MMYAFARGSRWLSRVNTAHRTPGPAIWVSATLAIVVTLYGDAFSVLSASSAVFLFISYSMPIAAGVFAEGRTWTEALRLCRRRRCARAGVRGDSATQ
jgi:amino acid transporter